ncbi:lysosomal protective protein-like [Styela clava]
MNKTHMFIIFYALSCCSLYLSLFCLINIKLMMGGYTLALFGIFCFTVACTNAAPQEDLITELPGLSTLPKFKQYSGYLQASGTKHLHYWFVESQRNSASDPVVLWLNGGPGCSSLDGLLSENGPIHVHNDGNSLYMNPYSWNKLANVIFLESPAGVGYSYDDNNNVKTGDSEVASHNYAALLDFFKKFPEYLKNEFYVTGESYGGVYVPTLTEQIADDKKLNLKGFAVGNGLSSMKLNDESLVYFAYYHGLLGDVLWNKLLSTCCVGGFTRDNCSFHEPRNSACGDYVQNVMEIVYSSGLNTYALYMDCDGGSQRQKTYKFTMANLFRNLDAGFRKKLLSTKMPYANSLLRETPPCINSTAQKNYLNKPDVRKALHIPSHLPKWDICNEDVGSQYKREFSDMMAQYKKLMAVPGLRGLVYNGDTDMACNFLGDEWFVDSLGLPPVHDRVPWYVDGQVAGFTRAFKQLTYTTIRGSGHMVPQWAPSYAYTMFEKFLFNQPLMKTTRVPK